MTTPLDRYLRHDELGQVLHRLAAEHPDLVTLDEIGRSHEGRAVWLVTVTDRRTGPHHDKPAHWVDANIHATELTGSAAALALLDRLVTGFGVDETVTRAVSTRTFYVVPRVNPDGAELALAERPRLLRSSTRPWPWRDGRLLPGLHPEDLDGDGVIRSMRIADPDGAWVCHPDDERLMVPRPVDGATGGRTTYRMLAEGLVHEHDGFTVPVPPPPEGLDLNRNFPAGWGTTVKGSGDFPGSEPEVQNLLRAIVARPNICGYHAFHTFGGVLLRPSSTRPDSSLPKLDLWTMDELGRRTTELTTYPVHSVYEDFTWDRTALMSGAADDWAYDHLGIYGWTTEFWDVVHHATGERSKTDTWFVGPTVEQELAVLQWCDRHVPGAYAPWRPFDHPQLGRVEIGGWDDLYVWRNPPTSMLEAEVRPHADTIVFQALASPALQLPLLDARPTGGDTWQVRAGVANTGWLPTDVTKHARDQRLTLPVVVEIRLPDGASLVGGTTHVEVGQLEGRRELRFQGGEHHDGTPDRALTTWVVRAPSGTTVTVEARHQRAGTVRRTLVLGP